MYRFGTILINRFSWPSGNTILIVNTLRFHLKVEKQIKLSVNGTGTQFRGIQRQWKC